MNNLEYIMKHKNITISENAYVVIIDDIPIKHDSIWGYYYRNESLSNMNLYISEDDYKFLSEELFSFNKELVGSKNFMISTNSAYYISDEIFKKSNNKATLSIGNISVLCCHDTDAYNSYINPIYFTLVILLDNKKDLAKFKLCFNYPSSKYEILSIPSC